MRSALLLPLVLLVACGTPGFDGPPRQVPRDAGGDAGGGTADSGEDPVEEAQGGELYRSGSRLRAEVWAGEDGSSQFAGWYDTERGESCGITTAADGELRCLPTGVLGSRYFADEHCSVPAIVVSASVCVGGEPRFAAVSSPTACGAGLSIYALGRPLDSFWMRAGETCQEVQSADLRPFELGPEEPPGAFVRMSRARQ